GRPVFRARPGAPHAAPFGQGICQAVATTQALRTRRWMTSGRAMIRFAAAAARISAWNLNQHERTNSAEGIVIIRPHGALDGMAPNQYPQICRAKVNPRRICRARTRSERRPGRTFGPRGREAHTE